MGEVHPRPNRRRGPWSGFDWSLGKLIALALIEVGGRYRNLRRLTDADRRQILRWRRQVPDFGRLCEAARSMADYEGPDSEEAAREFLALLALDPDAEPARFRAELKNFCRRWAIRWEIQ